MQQRLNILIIILALTMMVFGCGEMEGKEAAQAGEVQDVVLPIEGMSCMACVARVKKELTALEGVEKVGVELQQRRASITFQPSEISVEELQETIKGMGYQAGTPEK